MAYTTEEQDFQSFLQKLKQIFPQIVLSIALAFAVYYGYNKYKSYTDNKVISEYQEFQGILAGNGSLDDKAKQMEEFINNYPKNPLAINGILDLVKQYTAQKEYQKALDLINTVSSNNANNTNLVAITKAKLLWQLGQSQQAVALLTNISDDTWFDQAHTLAGDIYYSENDYKNAVAEYTKTKDHINNSIAKKQESITKIIASTNNKTEIQDIQTKIQSLEGQKVWIQTRLNVANSKQNELNNPTKVETTEPVKATTPAESTSTPTAKPASVPAPKPVVKPATHPKPTNSKPTHHNTTNKHNSK